MPAKKVTPDVDLNPHKSFTYMDEVYYVKSRYKIGKFFKFLESNPVLAIEVILEEESFERFEELEMNLDEFKGFVEAMSGVISGGDSKN